MRVVTDIDIDVADRDLILGLFRHVPATLTDGRKHNTGVYFHDVPVDPRTGQCTIPYKEAEDEYGLFKMDILNVHVYRGVRDREHLDELMSREPIWESLEVHGFCSQLFHLNGHEELCALMKPRSIGQLAAVLAVIRPSKRHLAGRPWDEVMEEVWKKDPDGGYSFKKSHAVAYAEVVRVQMNMLMDELESGE